MPMANSLFLSVRLSGLDLLMCRHIGGRKGHQKTIPNHFFCESTDAVDLLCDAYVDVSLGSVASFQLLFDGCFLPNVARWLAARWSTPVRADEQHHWCRIWHRYYLPCWLLWCSVWARACSMFFCTFSPSSPTTKLGDENWPSAIGIGSITQVCVKELHTTRQPSRL